MAIWLIEFKGSGLLDDLFLLIATMTAPVWLAMLVYPGSPVVRNLATPLILPLVFLVVPLTIAVKAGGNALVPAVPETATYQEAKFFAKHPVAFLLFFCNLQIGNLAIGTLVYQKGLRHKMAVPVELVSCWIFGPLGLLVFSTRLLIARKSLKV